MWPLLKKSYAAWDADDGQRMGAALAYYAVFTLAPLLMIAVELSALVLGRGSARVLAVSAAERVIGPQSAEQIRQLLAALSRLEGGSLAGAAALGALLLGALGAVAELRSALDRIWKLPEPPASLRGFLWSRAVALAAMSATGLLLAVSLILSAAVASRERLGAQHAVPEALLHALNLAASAAAIAPVFALIYRYLPRALRAWRDAWAGAAATALLFGLGNVVLGAYLGKAGFTSTYGAAGSLVAIMVWTYYCAQIFYFGAEFTQVYGLERASRRKV